jgi:hypothetical protein
MTRAQARDSAWRSREAAPLGNTLPELEQLLSTMTCVITGTHG